ncbi:hypothetical protein Dimus_039228 [Dionaea muscipula]
MENPTSEHMQLCKRILRYVKATLSYGLWYQSSSSCFSFHGYSDSDWGGDVDHRKSTTGFVCFLGETAFSWVSKKQLIVALSSTESEYIAAASCVSHVLWLRQLLLEMRLCQELPTNVFVDNQSAIAVAKNPVYHDRSKHIDVRFHFLREAIAREDVELVFVRTEFQAADILTKPLGFQAFSKLRALLGVTSQGRYLNQV